MTNDKKVTQKDIIIVTKNAAEKIKELSKHENKEGYGLKFHIMPGGCSDFQYGLDFEEKPGDTDTVIKQHGVSIFIEKGAIDLVKGATIDFMDTQTESGFKIENPNAKSSCGCKKSSC